MAAPFQLIQFAPGEALTLNFTMTTNGLISTYTLTFTAKLPDGSTVFTCTVGNGITITGNGGISSAGTFAVAPTAAQTGLFQMKTVGTWDLWRTNSGLEAQLAYGNLQAGPQYLAG